MPSCHTTPAREGETAQDLRERLSETLRRVRQANIAMGTNAEGKTRYLWMQLSQSPERRRRVQLAGKCQPDRDRVARGDNPAQGDQGVLRHDH